jgi:iron only hydrogenase large subunit-like protein
MNKNNIAQIEKSLKNKNQKLVALVAPSFISEFSYPSIISQLKALGFDKVVELTFGAKMINREYHRILQNSNELLISSACPGIVESIKNNPELSHYSKNIIPVDSPMIAMAKICKKTYPKHKTCFLSPCHFKKIEAESSKYIDYVLDYNQLKKLFEKNLIPLFNKKDKFDKFYNDYTKIFPLSGGLFKTAKLRGILRKRESRIIDGWNKIEKLLKKERKIKNLKFLDVTFCVGGCIGGPCTNTNISISKKKKKLIKYLKESKREDIPETKKGLIEKAKGINFLKR